MTTELKTWPERIWLQHGEDEVPAYPGPGSETTWCEDSINHNDIEYVRADIVGRSAVHGEESDKPDPSQIPTLEQMRELLAAPPSAQVAQEREANYQAMADAVNSIDGWSGFTADDCKQLLSAMLAASQQEGG